MGDAHVCVVSAIMRTKKKTRQYTGWPLKTKPIDNNLPHRTGYNQASKQQTAPPCLLQRTVTTYVCRLPSRSGFWGSPPLPIIFSFVPDGRLSVRALVFSSMCAGFVIGEEDRDRIIMMIIIIIIHSPTIFILFCCSKEKRKKKTSSHSNHHTHELIWG